MTAKAAGPIGRFELLELAGEGGMGRVYRARDRESGQVVALKVRKLRQASQRERFLREAGVLSELSHPAIVEYVDHGVTDDGLCYLAMKWLEGEDLRTRLGRRGLSLEETLTMVRRVAEGLAVVHDAGWVHRDLKPSNLFLVDGDPARVEVLDFGVVRNVLETAPVTETGALVGTLGYLSPEQARGDREVDARSDLFSLGCVMFECLTGRPAFPGAQPGAVLGRILFGPTPKVSRLKPSLPRAVEHLVSSLLAKEPEDRLPDAASLLEGIACVTSGRLSPIPSPALVETSLTEDEQRLQSVMLVAPAGGGGDGKPRAGGWRETLRERLAGLEGEVAPLVDGSLLVRLEGQGTARDLAGRMASCARALSEGGELRIVLATGPAALTDGGSTGEAIDRAAAVLARGREPGVFLDDVTAGLLDGPFELRADERGIELVSDWRDDGARCLLGKPTPCVGRAKELAFLEGVFDEAIEERQSAAVLVMGGAGVGKTRLVREVLDRMRRRHDVRVVLARGEPVAAGSSFAVASQLVRRALGLREGDDVAAQRQHLGEELLAFFEGDALSRVTGFLGELIQVATEEPRDPLLRAAKHDGRVESEQIKLAFSDWLGALCAAGPVALVIDDLQFGDRPSIALIGHAIRRLAESPLIVLSAARMEIADLYPDLWDDVGGVGITLGPLKRPAAERLVRGVLGEVCRA